MNLQKNKPFRSKEFMKFLHERRDLVGWGCTLCSNQWSQLHHWGRDGGTGMKPSDLYLVKLCKTCADSNEIKMTALVLAGYHSRLYEFFADSMHNVECWLKYRRENGRLKES